MALLLDSKALVNATMRGLTGLLCRVDDHALAQVPADGPLIVVANHVNFLDAPVLLSRAYPRPVSSFTKVETFDHPLLRVLFTAWEAIPIERGTADLKALRLGLEALDQGRIVVILPEGTRSRSGVLQCGKPGVATLALRSGAPVLPLCYYGHEHFGDNVRHLRRTPVHIAVGASFSVSAEGEAITRALRQRITDEIMYQVAALMPASYRGYYADLAAATEQYLRFAPGVTSNVRAALFDPRTWSGAMEARPGVLGLMEGNL